MFLLVETFILIGSLFLVAGYIEEQLFQLNCIMHILNGFVVVQENIKPSVLMHRPCKLGLYFSDLGLYIFLYNDKTG